MRITSLFSKRQKELRGEVPDVFSYDKLPQELRVQIVHILKDYLGSEEEAYHSGKMVGGAYKFIVDTLCREYGMFRLPGTRDRGNRDYISELLNFILSEEDVERTLDAVELSASIIDAHSREWKYRHHQNADEEATDALAELNERFKLAGIGYRYESGNIIRVDSELLHAEVIKPALALLHDGKYMGAQAEFLLAFEHYRHGRAKEALSECLKTLESVMKTIAKSKNWPYESNATSKPLLDLMFQKELIPQLWAQHYSGLRAMLESGVPTARNRLGGHGQGAEIVAVPEHYVAFALHQTAAAVVFLTTSAAAAK
jgi:AbiJ N-terminal domain 4